MNIAAMNHVETFEDEGFVYELNVEPARHDHPHLFTFSQGNGYYCRWNIVNKGHRENSSIAVTDDQCELIVFDSVESAVRGAKDFLSMQA